MVPKLALGSCSAVHGCSSVVRVQEEANRLKGVECCRLMAKSKSSAASARILANAVDVARYCRQP